MGGFIHIRKGLAVMLLLSFIPVFALGLIVGIGLDRKFEAGEKALSVRILKAMEAGESRVVGDLVITPDKSWTPERPVNYIWPRVRHHHEVVIAGGSDQGVRRVWEGE